MLYEWDDAKRRETLESRGIDFAEIYGFDWDTADTRPSNRHGEERWASLGMIGNRLYYVVWVWRRRKPANYQLAKSQQTGE